MIAKCFDQKESARFFKACHDLVMLESNKEYKKNPNDAFSRWFYGKTFSSLPA